VGKIRAMSLFYKSIDNQLNKINEEHMTHNQVVTGSSPVGPTLEQFQGRIQGLQLQAMPLISGVEFILILEMHPFTTK